MEASQILPERKARFHVNWTTAKEKNFIDNMGSYRPRDIRSHKPYLALLIGYLRGIQHRKQWGDGLDPMEILSYVELKITRERLRRS